MLSEEEYSRLGLTTLQGQVLITLMELGGEASAPEIFKKLSKSHKINRTSIYTVLAKLEYLGLVLSKEGGRGNNFSLVATSPKVLLSKILEPQKPVLEKFEKQLRAAKEQQSTKIEYELYYLQNRDQIRNQLELIIGKSVV